MKRISTPVKSALAITAALMFGPLAFAQQSAFQSANGQTSLYLQNGGAATLNLSDTKISVGRYFRESNHSLVLGYDIFGKASSGTTTPFSSKVKVPEGGGDFVMGWHPKVDTNAPLSNYSTNDQWALVDVGYSRSSLYISDTTISAEKAKRNFDRFRAVGVYNKIVGRFALGVAAGAERRNNVDELKDVTFQTTIIPASPGTSDSIVKSKSGFFGSYREYIAAPVYIDIVYVVPKLTAPGFSKTGIAIDGFTRSDVARTRRSVDGGLGVFVIKQGAPTKVYGGIAASWNDGKAKVALIASWNF